MMQYILRFASILLAAALPSVAPAKVTTAPVTILISIDAFRADYLQRGLTPNLLALAAGGATAPMRPSFPSKTYPNHYTLVTGLRPDRHGVIGNRMLSADRPGELFTMSNDKDAYWWRGGEPIWATAERAGLRTASLYWPGSDVAYDGIRPHDWQHWDGDVTDAQRIDAVVDWLRRPAATRPRLIAAYFDTIDEEGHHHGPDSPELDAALMTLDTQIGRLRQALARFHLRANIVIVSDHGMASTSRDRVVMLDTLADPADYTVVEDGTYASLNPVAGHEAALAGRLLPPHAHVHCWRKADIPARLDYGRNPRVPAFLCLADVGWLVLKAMPKTFDVGNHGYDNDAPEMRAIFIAHGPAFRSGTRLATFDNVAIAPLLRRLLGLSPARDLDGTIAPLLPALR